MSSKPRSTASAFVESIHLLCKELARDYILNDRKSSPDLMAKLTRVLLESEQKIGGPYFEKGVDPYITNFAIMELASLIGIRLPNIKAYTYPKRPSHLKENLELKNLNNFFVNISVKKNEMEEVVYKPSDHAYAQLLKETSSIPIKFQAKYRELVNKIQMHDKNGEISNIASYFNILLRDSGYKEEKMVICSELDKANVLAWMAYIIYDDVIDEGSSYELIPIANIMMRRSYMLYLHNADLLGASRSVVESHFDTVDTNFVSNIEELSPATLHVKSIGHVLAIKLLWEQASERTDTQMNTALEQFLNAKQLCDDMKDWEEDLKSSNQTYVTYAIQEKSRNLSNEAAYWKYVLPNCIQIAEAQIENSILLFLEIFGNNLYESMLYKKMLFPIKDQLSALKKDHEEKNAFLDRLFGYNLTHLPTEAID